MLESRLRGYIVYGVEPELDCGDSGAARSALTDAELVVACSAYRTAAMEAYADVLLPVAVFAETAGTFVNAQGTWQSFTGAVSPPGEARPGWKVLRVLGNSLDLPGFEHVESTDVLDEVAVEFSLVEAFEFLTDPDTLIDMGEDLTALID